MSIGVKRKYSIHSLSPKHIVAAVLFIFSLQQGAFARTRSHANREYAVHSGQIISHPITFAIATDSGLHHKHRLIAALLAFPLPGGILGLHRIYLGTHALVPLVYIATFGGIFGVVPFVDFVLILVCKDVNTYSQTSTLFMWSRKKK